TVAMLTNSTNPGNARETQEIETAATALGLRLVVLDASDLSGIDRAFESFAWQPVDAMIVSADLMFLSRRVQLAVLAARDRLPTIYAQRDAVEVGGLVSYGAVPSDAWQQAGIYVARILKGEKPSDLPVVQPTQFRLVINLSTAKALGLTIPETLL